MASFLFQQFLNSLMAKQIGPPQHFDPHKFVVEMLDIYGLHTTRVDYDIDAYGACERYTFEFVRPIPSSAARLAPANSFFAGPPGISKVMSPMKMPPKPLKDLGTSIEPIVAYREWGLRGDVTKGKFVLESRNGEPWWPYLPLIASCNDSFLVNHDSPGEDCVCGIYAWNPEHKNNYLEKGVHGKLWGEVYLWGKVFICEYGYRAEYAYPKSIFMKDTGTKRIKEIAVHLCEDYGVPVNLVPSTTKDMPL